MATFSGRHPHTHTVTIPDHSHGGVTAGTESTDVASLTATVSKDRA